MVTRKLFYAAAAAIASASAWLINIEYPSPYFVKTFETLLALTITYVLFKLIFEEAFVKRIRESKMRYSFRKAVSIIYVVVLSVVLIRVWIETPEALLVSFGLIGAGVAIALQDVFKNFVGGALIFFTGCIGWAIG